MLIKITAICHQKCSPLAVDDDPMSSTALDAVGWKRLGLESDLLPRIEGACCATSRISCNKPLCLSTLLSLMLSYGTLDGKSHLLFMEVEGCSAFIVRQA